MSEEKLLFLKREEIRTMAKDIARLQEEEALKEKERISKLKIEEKLKKETREIEKIAGTMIPKEEGKTIEIPEPLLPKSIKPSPLEKVFVRTALVVFIVLFILAIGFTYWFVKVKKNKEPGTLPSPSPAVLSSPLPASSPSLFPNPSPISLIPVKETRELQITSAITLKSLLQETIKTGQPQGAEPEFIRLTALKDGSVLGLKDFLTELDIKAPEKLFEQTGNSPDDFTFFLYAKTNEPRLGFIAKIKDESAAASIMKDWEKTMEKDLEPLFSLLGKTEKAIVPYFRAGYYNNLPIRYQTFSKNDLGICYLILNNRLIFAASWEEMKGAVDAVRAEEVKTKIGQLFIVGIEGKTLSLETEQFFKKYRPGGVLLLSKNIENQEQLIALTNKLQNLSLKETGLPLLIAVDQEGGTISRIAFAKEKTAQKEIKTAEDAFVIGKERGKELKELGINLNLAPLLDSSVQGDFIFDRSFQKDAAQAGILAQNLVAGQKSAGILTVIKHFPGYKAVSFNPEEKLGAVEFLPDVLTFKTAMKALPEFVMTANLIYKEIDQSLPFSFSPKAIKLLKDILGQDILVISDDLDQNSLLEKYSLKEIVAKPIEAGADMIIFSGFRLPAEQGLERFLEAAKNKEISQEKIDQAFARIVNLKKKMIK